MKKALISFIILIISFFVAVGLANTKEDYLKIYSSIQSTIKPFTRSESSKQINIDKETSEIFQHGLNSVNLFKPYLSQDHNLKDILSGLANFTFILRSAASTRIYNSCVKATVLVVAPEIGSGTGFIIDKKNKLIVTNYHVTRGLKRLFIAYYNEKITDPAKLKYYPADVVRYSAKRDVAILKITSIPVSAPQLNLSLNSKYEIGQEVHTIGHPMSLTWTYSRGQITAIRSNFQFGEEKRADVIQIDASISPGNSGGPLIDENRTVIGMVTFAANSRYAQNLNFAVSAKDINSTLKRVRNEDTTASKTLNKIKGMELISMNDIRKSCIAYRIDENKDGETDYIVFIDKKTKKEKYRYVENFEMEINRNTKFNANIILIDISDDGIYDIILVDMDQNNMFDMILIDTNSDEMPDIIGIDAKGEGKISEVWIL